MHHTIGAGKAEAGLSEVTNDGESQKESIEALHRDKSDEERRDVHAIERIRAIESHHPGLMVCAPRRCSLREIELWKNLRELR